MENYIFNCYKKWLKDQNGSIAKQLSKLNKIARFLVAALFIVLAAVLVTYFLSFFKIIDEIWVFVNALIEVAIGIAAYIYTSKYEINHSDDEFKNYFEYCKNLSTVFAERKILSYSFIRELIGRYKVIIDDSNKKIERNQDRIDKYMQILIIPLFLAVLSKMLDMQADAQSAISAGISAALGIAFLYLIIVLPVNMYNNIAIKNRQNNYKQLVNDLQSIIDFKIAVPLEEEITDEQMT